MKRLRSRMKKIGASMKKSLSVRGKFWKKLKGKIGSLQRKMTGF